MRSTRKKTSKPVYKDENDSEPDGDFSDSGSDAQISEQSASSDDDDEDAFQDSFHQETSSISVKVPKKTQTRKQININIKPNKTKFAKELINKICSRKRVENEDDHCDVAPYFSVKNMTESDKLLPSILNLSESDSSDDDAPKPTKKKAVPSTSRFIENKTSESETEASEYRDVWSKNLQDSEEIAKQTFLELEKHKTEVEETKASIQKYTTKHAPDNSAVELDIKDLLAQGEAFSPEPVPTKKTKRKKVKNDSDSEMEDWEEVDEAKAIPNQGLQLIVDFPGAPTRKQKTLDVEMMMRRKINRVKKEYQVYMHKVHVLCWLGHGNYVSRVINDQEVLAAALSLVPSKECYPSDRVDIKYLEQITKWYKDKMTIKQDKNEEKFRPKAPPLKELLLSQIKNKTATTKKYLVFIFVALLRALGLQCRVMFNFVVLPLKPPSSELCSLSTKQKDGIKNTDQNAKPVSKKSGTNKAKIDKKGKPKAIPQIDGNIESCSSDSDSDIENIIQVDGSNDSQVKTRKGRSKVKKDNENVEDVSPPKRTKLLPEPKEASSKLNVESVKPEAKTSKIDANKIKTTKMDKETKENSKDRVSVTRKRTATSKSEKSPEPKKVTNDKINDSKLQDDTNKIAVPSPRKTRNASKSSDISEKKSNSNKINKPVQKQALNKSSKKDVPKLKLNDVEFDDVPSKYFGKPESSNVSKILSLSRKRTQSAKTTELVQTKESETKSIQAKARTRSAPGNSIETSKYFDASDNKSNRNMKCTANPKAKTKDEKLEDMQRVSHKDLASKNKLIADEVTTALVDIIKSRVREAKVKSKIGLVKPKHTDSDEDSDHLPEEKHKVKHNDSDSDCDFKPTKISPRPAKLTPKATKLSPKPGSSRKIDRRVLSSEDELPTNKVNVWCEVYVEELEQWSPVDVVGGKVHCAGEIYSRATHPVCYIVGWDNCNRLKDLTRRYVPQWNTVTRKLRADAAWWRSAVAPWLGASTPRDREEDEQLDRMQIEAPLPKSVAEYKNHPLYALKRHLLKFEAIYPADAPTLGFVRNEPVYARECVHTCRSRDTWLKEAKVVRLGEKPYKIVKARPKWDKLSNRMISDIPLEVFGPWQVADYEPPTAENGVVPRNAYGNVELFKMCMLPKGTVHVKLPGLNKVAKKLNIDCAPAMTGFDYNGGYSHPVYDGYVVCAEFEEVITEAWLLDQEEQERKENEKLETRVYGNWKRLIKGLLIRERLKHKYGFQEPSTSKDAKSKPKAPKLVVKKKSCL